MRQKKRERRDERDTGRMREAISGCAYLDVCLLVEQALGYCGGGERHTLNQVQRRHGDAHPQDTHTHTLTHHAGGKIIVPWLTYMSFYFPDIYVCRIVSF